MNATTLFLLGGALGVLALLLTVLCCTAFFMGEMQLAGAFMYGALFTVFAAGLLIFGFAGSSNRMKRSDTTVLMLLIWTVLPIFAAIPFFVSGEYSSYVHAYFEAVSGLTTTGATTVEDLSALGASTLIWRAALQGFGGALTLLTAVLVLAPFDAATSPTNSTIPGYEEGDLAKSILSSVREILPIYLTILGFALVLLWLAGLPGQDALIYAMTSVSTGGFTAGNEGLSAYDSQAAEIIICVAMVLGATSFLAHRATMLRLPTGGHSDTRETLIVVALLPVCTLALVLIMWLQEVSTAEAVRHSVFRAVSLLTTTGFDSAPATFPVVPSVFVLALIAVGGASFSTAGGIKLFRVSTMFVQAHREIKRLIHPHGISSAKAVGKSFDIQIMKSIWALFVVFLVSTGAVALVLGLEGESHDVAITAAVAALSNAGPALGMTLDAGGGPAEGYLNMSQVSLLSLCVGMILGKVEFLTLLGLAGWWWHSLK